MLFDGFFNGIKGDLKKENWILDFLIAEWGYVGKVVGQHGRVGLFGAYSTSHYYTFVAQSDRDFTRHTLLTVHTYIKY